MITDFTSLEKSNLSNPLSSTKNNEALLMALQIPYDLFMEQLYKSREAIFFERHSFHLPKASHIKVRNEF